uniref:Aromatic-L-amino-acid decarboxylase n=1 Tax=Macrostomum lignano TaxID=282301 RepID=A0A1I8II82_9PLAT
SCGSWARHLIRCQPRLLTARISRGLVSGALDLQAAHSTAKLMSQHVLAEAARQMPPLGGVAGDLRTAAKENAQAFRSMQNPKPRLRPPILSSDLLSLAMDREEFRRQGKAMVDFIADYFASFRQRQVVPDVRPGYLRPLIPAEPPQAGEPFENVMADLERVVLSGSTHSFHPKQLADSFNFNPGKWLQITFDCSALWLKDSSKVVNTFNVDPLYLQHEFSGLVPDYRHWQIPLGRRFRSLKIWFVLRSYGIEGLQSYIRKHIRLAKQFEELVTADDRFEIVEEVLFGLVCFRLKARLGSRCSNSVGAAAFPKPQDAEKLSALTQLTLKPGYPGSVPFIDISYKFQGANAPSRELYRRIRVDGRIHLIASEFEASDTFFIRFAVCSEFCEAADIRYAYDVISELANEVLSKKYRLYHRKILACLLNGHTKQADSIVTRCGQRQSLGSHHVLLLLEFRLESVQLCSTAAMTENEGSAESPTVAVTQPQASFVNMFLRPPQYQHGQDFELWLARFNNFASSLPVDQRKNALLSFLDDKSYQAASNLDAALSYDDFEKALKNRFRPSTSSAELQAQFFNLTQKDGQSVADYSDALIVAAKRAFPSLMDTKAGAEQETSVTAKDELLKGRFLSGLRDPAVRMQTQMQAKATFADTVETARFDEHRQRIETDGWSNRQRQLLSEFKRLTLVNGLLCRRWESEDGSAFCQQLLVPESLQRDVFVEAHAGTSGSHCGPQKTIEKIRARLYWPGMTADVTDWQRPCEWVAELRSRLQTSHERARQNLEAAQLHQKAAYDRRCHGEAFSENDLVWLHNPALKRGESRKFHRWWTGPWRPQPAPQSAAPVGAPAGTPIGAPVGAPADVPEHPEQPVLRRSCGGVSSGGNGGGGGGAGGLEAPVVLAEQLPAGVPRMAASESQRCRLSAAWLSSSVTPNTCSVTLRTKSMGVRPGPGGVDSAPSTVDSAGDETDGNSSSWRRRFDRGGSTQKRSSEIWRPPRRIGWMRGRLRDAASAADIGADVAGLIAAALRIIGGGGSGGGDGATGEVVGEEAAERSSGESNSASGAPNAAKDVPRLDREEPRERRLLPALRGDAGNDRQRAPPSLPPPPPPLASLLPLTSRQGVGEDGKAADVPGQRPAAVPDDAAASASGLVGCESRLPMPLPGCRLREDEIRHDQFRVQVLESELFESEFLESELLESELLELELLESEMFKSEFLESELFESEFLESEFLESELFESELIESELLESEVFESELSSPPRRRLLPTRHPDDAPRCAAALRVASPTTARPPPPGRSARRSGGVEALRDWRRRLRLDPWPSWPPSPEESDPGYFLYFSKSASRFCLFEVVDDEAMTPSRASLSTRSPSVTTCCSRTPPDSAGGSTVTRPLPERWCSGQSHTSLPLPSWHFARPDACTDLSPAVA